MSRRQTSSPSSFTLAALPRAQGGTSRVQRARRPPAQRRQLAEAAASRAAIGHEVGAGSSVNCQINSREEKKGKGKKKTHSKKYTSTDSAPFRGVGGCIAQTCSSVLKTIHYIDGGIQKYVAVETNSFS